MLGDSSAILGGAGLLALKPLSNESVPFDFASQVEAERWIRENSDIMRNAGNFTILPMYRLA
jgi:hypothetical protein